MLDPFCGVATSLLSAQSTFVPLPDMLVGVEVNPFVAWVARTKANWYLYNPEIIRNFIPKLVAKVLACKGCDDESALPPLSTINNPNYFDPNRLHKLLCIRTFIETNIPQPERDFFLLGWSAVLELASNLRKDGRALRRVENRVALPLDKLLEGQWMLMLQDLLFVNRAKIRREENTIVPVRIHNEDGRTLPSLQGTTELFDLVVYSPPYPNNIDYSEVYKVELWLNRFVCTQAEFRELRFQTLRSHPSVSFPETNHLTILDTASWPCRLTEALIEALPINKDFRWRSRLIRGYVEDMYLSLLNQYRLMKSNGYIICVVGNSVHGNSLNQYCIAADLLIASLAQVVGFQVKELVVARDFTRRKLRSSFNRESILIFRKM